MSHVPLIWRIYTAWRALRAHTIVAFFDGGQDIIGICPEDAAYIAIQMRSLSDICKHRTKMSDEEFEREVRKATHEYIDSEPTSKEWDY